MPVRFFRQQAGESILRRAAATVCYGVNQLMPGASHHQRERLWALFSLRYNRFLHLCKMRETSAWQR